MAADTLPFGDVSALDEYITRMVTTSAKSLTRARPDIPPSFACIVGKLLARDTEQRYQSAYGVVHDLVAANRAWKHRGTSDDYFAALGAQDIPLVLRNPTRLVSHRNLHTAESAATTAVEGGAALLLVSGVAGIGKSTLLHQLTASFGHGILHGTGICQFEHASPNYVISGVRRALPVWCACVRACVRACVCACVCALTQQRFCWPRLCLASLSTLLGCGRRSGVCCVDACHRR